MAIKASRIDTPEEIAEREAAREKREKEEAERDGDNKHDDDDIMG